MIGGCSRPPAAGVVGGIAFLLIGWSGLLVPSLIRSVKEAFDQSDAGIGLFYFLFSGAWAVGAFGGGLVTERLGRRSVLTLAAALIAVGLIGLGLAPSWAVFLVVALPGGLGAGMIDGGGNGLFLDLFQSGRGRALNLLHLFFSIGALTAPVTSGLLVENGVDWRSILVGTGLAAVPVAVLFAIVRMPGGRRSTGTDPACPMRWTCASPPTATGRAAPADGGRDRLLRRLRGRRLELARPLPGPRH